MNDAAKKSPQRVYLVRESNEVISLVRARTASEAIRHAIANRFSAEVASQDDLIRLVGDGMKVETAGETEPQT